VPQGSPLSPLLFNIAVRHLPRVCDTDLFQFADDLTNSASDKDLEGLSSKLQRSYEKIKEFCEDRKLKINPSKTQLIIFKSSNKRLSENFSLSIDGFNISPSPTVTLLGVTLDQHFTMRPHIESVVKKCHGLLGMLRRAGTSLPRELLKLIYVSMIRAQLEYCSATFVGSASTHLNKLDVIQKIASRIITDSPSQTHSAPLQAQLGLEPLCLRRHRHVSTLVSKILTGKSHPFFEDFFDGETDGTNGAPATKGLQLKRFRNNGLAIYNDYNNSLRAPLCPPQSNNSLGAPLCSPRHNNSLGAPLCPPRHYSLGAPLRQLHISSLGQPISQDTSQIFSSVILNSTASQQTISNELLEM